MSHVVHGRHAPHVTQSELRSLEEEHATLDLYCWLAYRMPHAFW